MAAVYAGPRALRCSVHHDRARRSHPAARGTVRGARAGARLEQSRSEWTLAARAPRGRLMSDLAAIQDDFQAYLLRGSQAIAGRVAGSTTVPVAVRLGIYGGAYGSRLSDALQANYAALAKLLDEDFPALAHEYVRSHDSPFFSIRYYGDQLARFLAAEEKYSGAPILAELASWESTMSCVFDAADATPITHEALTRVRPQEWARLR